MFTPAVHSLTRYAVCAAVLASAPFAASVSVAEPPMAAAGAYQVTARWKLAGAGGWDYVTMDAAHHRLFVTRGDRVEAVDTENGKVVGKIAGTAGVHAVVLVPELKRGYTSNGKANSITEFDIETLAVLREVPIAAVNPDAMVYVAAHRQLYVFNGKSRDLLVLDVDTLGLVRKVAMPDKPEFAQDDGHGHVFVNIESEKGQLVRIDTGTLAVDATWALPGCESPTGLALDRRHDRLFSVCDGKAMVVTDAKTGRQVARVAIGDGPDAAEFDQETGTVFVSNGDGSLTVIKQDSPDRYHVVANVPTQKGARTMTYDPTTRRAYVVTADFGPAPAATPESPHPRPVPLPDTFTVLVAGPR